MIYLDNAATTPMDPVVINTVMKSMSEDFANSGTVYKIGLDAKKKIEIAYEDIIESLGLPSSHKIIFTSGGSESNNLFIKGLGVAGKFIASTGVEHPSVEASIKWMMDENDVYSWMIRGHVIV